MRYLPPALAFLALLLIGGLSSGSHVILARQLETPTPSETPSQTPEVTGTSAATETPTPTATPDYYAHWQLSSGQAVEIKFSMSAGEIMITTLLLVLIGLAIFGLLLLLVKK